MKKIWMIIPIILVILVGIAVGRLIFNNKEKLANKNNVIHTNRQNFNAKKMIFYIILCITLFIGVI